MTFKLKTTKKIAKDSPDHLCPSGCISDNFSSSELIDEVIKYFNKEKISVLDLGCAGGQFIVDFIEKGHDGVGLEGSSHVLFGAGKKNWEKYLDSNLFLCDISEEYQLYNSDDLYKFDYIHSEEVFEHISEDRIDTMLQQIKKHLKPDGICSFGIALFSDIRNEQGENISEEEIINYSGKIFKLHQSVFPANWWKNKILDNGFELLKDGIFNENHFGYIFNNKVRNHGNNSCYICCKLK